MSYLRPLSNRDTSWEALPPKESPSKESPSLEAEKYSPMRMLKAIVNPKNAWRATQLAIHILVGNAIHLAGTLTNNRDLKEQGRIHIALHSHKESKIGRAFARKTLGDGLLVPMRNIASKDVLRGKTDKIEYYNRKINYALYLKLH